jgi:hypothetical protein
MITLSPRAAMSSASNRPIPWVPPMMIPLDIPVASDP